MVRSKFILFLIGHLLLIFINTAAIGQDTTRELVWFTADDPEGVPYWRYEDPLVMIMVDGVKSGMITPYEVDYSQTGEVSQISIDQFLKKITFEDTETDDWLSDWEEDYTNNDDAYESQFDSDESTLVVNNEYFPSEMNVIGIDPVSYTHLTLPTTSRV